MKVSKLEAILEIIGFAIELYRGYKRAKDERKEQKYLQAIRDGDTDYINHYLRPGKL